MKIYIISRPVIDNDEISKFLFDEQQTWQRTGDVLPGEELVEFAGRICYMSFGSRQSTKTNRGFISHLISQGHESVLEHPTWTFVVTGISRSFTHQLVRHRIGFSYSQMSQQYYDQKDSEFILPHVYQNDDHLQETLKTAIESSKTAYIEVKKILENKYNLELESLDGSKKKELKRYIQTAARSVLPNCIETKILFTANGRSIRNFLKVRGAVIGDFEMRIFSSKLLQLMKAEAPSLFRDFEIEVHDDGHPFVLQRGES